MDVNAFRQAHEPSWRKLEQQVKQRKQRFPTTASLTEFVQLYQSAASDLSYAQTFYPQHPVVRYLNTLVATAHNRLYQTESRGFLGIWDFLIAGFPQQVRALRRYLAVSFFVSFLGALFGYIMTLHNPLSGYALLPASLAEGVNPGQTGPHVSNAPVLSSTIMTHNMSVTLLAFLGGITLGIYTLYALWQNGLILGVLAGMFQTHHNAYLFWSLIVPHGVTELTAIFIGGAGGLLFAHALIAPGRLRRSAALRQSLIAAVQLMLGTVPMLIIAGSIEGFVTPSAMPAWMKYSVAVVTGAFWLLYFMHFGRARKRDRKKGHSALTV